MEHAKDLGEQAAASKKQRGLLDLAEGHQEHVLDLLELPAGAWERVVPFIIVKNTKRGR